MNAVAVIKTSNLSGLEAFIAETAPTRGSGSLGSESGPFKTISYTSYCSRRQLVASDGRSEGFLAIGAASPVPDTD
jgi:hypothetical protein